MAACLRAFHPLIPVIASGLRGAWQELIDLQPLELPPGLAEIRGELEGDAMAIDNELKCCPGLRKMHLETAQVGARLDILHCVLFPDPRYNLPLFGADVVAGPAGVSAAIVDLSPTGSACLQRWLRRWSSCLNTLTKSAERCRLGVPSSPSRCCLPA